MICPACGFQNLPGQDECASCLESLMQEDVPQPDTPARWRIMVDPISSLAPSTIDPQIVPAGTSLAGAIARMREKNVGCVMVTDAGGKLAGVLTEHDVLCRITGRVQDLNAHTVEQFMTHNPTTLSPDDPIKHALHFMALDEYTYIPLVDDQGRPVDLLSFRRIARLIEQME